MSDVSKAGRQPRVALYIQAHCTNEAGELFVVRVKNLSETGVGGSCSGVPPVSVGEEITLDLRDARRIRGEVVRVDRNIIGIAFSRRLNAERLDIKAWWTGPSFEVADMHKVADRCWRPGF
jgi:PilZ domain